MFLCVCCYVMHVVKGLSLYKPGSHTFISILEEKLSIPFAALHILICWIFKSFIKVSCVAIVLSIAGS